MEGDNGIPQLSIDELQARAEAERAEIVERGRATQFKPGNQAAKGHGRGRPKKSLSALRDREGEWAIRFLKRVATDKTNEYHDRFAIPAAMALLKVCVPRAREHTGRNGAKLQLVDVHELIFGKRRDDGDEDEGDEE